MNIAANRPAEAALLAAEIRRGAARNGVRTADIRRVRREYSKKLSKAGPETVLSIARHLLKSGGIVDRFIAYELVNHHNAALQSLREKDLLWLGAGLDSWGAVDCFACYISGPVWRKKQVPDRVIREWTRSPDRWWRRAALVSTVPLNSKARGGTGDTRRTLAICKKLAADPDDMVQKALSWALRELSKRDAQSVREFLSRHRGVLAARVIREVGNKLLTGMKNPRKRDMSS